MMKNRSSFWFFITEKTFHQHNLETILPVQKRFCASAPSDPEKLPLFPETFSAGTSGSPSIAVWVFQKTFRVLPRTISDASASDLWRTKVLPDCTQNCPDKWTCPELRTWLRSQVESHLFLDSVGEVSA